MTELPYDKIRILLIDDMPTRLPQDSRWDKDDRGPPQIDIDYEDWFDFRWIATPQEACEYRDLSWMLAQHDPMLLDSDGWVPELLVLDYALTQDMRTVSSRVGNEQKWVERLSPLPPLRRRARLLFSKAPVERKAFQLLPPAGSEYWGCFIGGLLMNTFADHPCAPITITVYDQPTLKSKAVDAAFFEWLMDTQSNGLLRAGGQMDSPSWHDIIPQGIVNLRHRLLALAKANIIQVSLEDLLSLADSGNHAVLTVTSRYGRRRYPVAGLFADAPSESRATAASEWSRVFVEQAWIAAEQPGSASSFDQTFNDLNRGRAFAQLLWDAYCNDNLFGRRMRLSELLGRKTGRTRDKAALSPDDEQELKELISYFSIADAGRPNPSCGRNFVELRHPDYDAPARRWAVLLIVVRLLHDRHCAVDVDRRLRGLPSTRDREIDIALEAPITPADVYLALFPIAQTPVVLPWHAQKADPTGSWSRYLKDLKLDLKELLDGEGKQVTTSGERLMLRMFAESVGAEHDDWGPDDWRQRRDPLACNVLFGKSEAGL